MIRFLFALLLTLPTAGRAQSVSFPIASHRAAMSWAFDGSNYLVGLETAGSPQATIGAQMISPDGTMAGSLIPTGRTGLATAVAFDGTNYLMIWEDNDFGKLTNESYQIYGQFISKAGVAVGSPFNISGLGVQFDGIKTLAWGGGKYLVTYTRLVPRGDQFDRHIAGRIVDPNGEVGSEFRISSGEGKASDVAFDGVNFFVVWCEDLLDQEIRGRFVSPAGMPGLEISINASIYPSDNPNSVTFDGANYLVVWNDEVGGLRGWDSFGQLVSPSGVLVGETIAISSEAESQIVTSVAFDGTHFLAVWVDMQNETNWDVYGQFLGRDGRLVGPKMVISSDPGNQLGGVGFANGTYLVLVNNGVNLGEGGIKEVDSATGSFIAPLPNPRVQTGDARFGVRTNRFGFTITGPHGLAVVVEASTNLAKPTWSPVQTNILNSGSAYFSDPQWTNFPTRFYQLRLP